ncbi:MAG: acetyl-CoA carboxylase [Alphaproteobacteria bacterium]|nr:acetyl-CoA carboxylase [Rhizobiaceae bacterium]MBU3964108.1 acetyl-CoA carboxylase [Alphaproteobacteria bacterium]MBU4048304.1 acetyl-CoA carboxylase [Alphaproteobacteria bacterium]MBU4089152.1 acetyl-CoA carboxylase [Alphaproteobacteria bacterium]MBU4158625.1 acetyl-CoA carboxylase [Alphaproteobacteria bacterium]
MSSAWIESVLELMRRHGIAEFEYQDDTRHVVASGGEVFEVGQRAEEPAAPAPRRAETVAAPHIGLFLPEHPSSAKDAALPRLVRRGEIIGYLKAGAVLRPVVAPSDGVLSRQLARTGALVGYGTPLFELHAADL